MIKRNIQGPPLAIYIGIVFLVLISIYSNAQHIPGKQIKPNIILILADDMGYGDLGCYGNPDIKTPNIDALAKGGMKFTDFHSNGVVCTPTRAALLTGRYQQRTGLDVVLLTANPEHNDLGLPLSEVTIAELLKKSGYSTALFGKWHLGSKVQFNPVNQGFNEFRGYVSGNVDYQSHRDSQKDPDWWLGTALKPESGYVTDLVTQHGLTFLEQNKKKPFFLFLSHEAVHAPYQGPNAPAYRVADSVTSAASQQDRKIAYKEMLESLDAGVGKIVSTVKKLGLEKNTLIIFCSDNGPTGPGSSGTLNGKKGTMWEGGHRVPGIFYWPGRLQPGSVSTETVMTMDLLPTISSICGTQPVKNLRLDGIDISSSIFSNKKAPERVLFWQNSNDQAVRQGKWKLLVIKKNKGSEVMLYDLNQDPSEQHDISQQHPEKVEELQALLKDWRKDVIL